MAIAFPFPQLFPELRAEVRRCMTLRGRVLLAGTCMTEREELSANEPASNMETMLQREIERHPFQRYYVLWYEEAGLLSSCIYDNPRFAFEVDYRSAYLHTLRLCYIIEDWTEETHDQLRLTFTCEQYPSQELFWHASARTTLLDDETDELQRDLLVEFPEDFPQLARTFYEEAWKKDIHPFDWRLFDRVFRPAGGTALDVLINGERDAMHDHSLV